MCVPGMLVTRAYVGYIRDSSTWLRGGDLIEKLFCWSGKRGLAMRSHLALGRGGFLFGPAPEQEGEEELDAKGVADTQGSDPKRRLGEWEEQGQPEWDMKQGSQERNFKKKREREGRDCISRGEVSGEREHR